MKVLPFRFRYFLSHLLISVLVAGISLFLIFGIWYPAPLHRALGVGELVILMLAIDVILGPLLTLVLAKEGKKGLKMDLVLIGMVQLSALFYGLYTVNQGRPVAIAFDINRFEIVINHTVKGDGSRQMLQQYQNEQSTRIPVVSIRPAKNEEEQAKRMKDELENNIMTNANPTLYESVAQNIDIIKQTMKPIDRFAKLNGERADEILEQYPNADGFLPLAGSAKTLTVLVDTKNKQFVAVVDANPW